MPLGTAGFFPSQTGRETCTVLVRVDRTLILFDAGTGTRWLADPAVRALLGDCDELHVVFSHFHLDHVAGLTWLVRLWDHGITLHVPSRDFVDADGEAVLRAISSPPYFAYPLESWWQKPTFRTFTADVFDVGGIDVRALKQVHPGGSVGYRVRDFAYIQDTEPTKAHEAFLDGIRLFLIDTMYDVADFSNRPGGGANRGHGSSETSGRLAHAVDAEQVGLVHLNPRYDEFRLQVVLDETRQFHPGAFVPNERACVTLEGRGAVRDR
jgi:ribonuclease BN (tRNA processing enzyme)